MPEAIDVLNDFPVSVDRWQGLKISRALRKLVVVHPVHEQQINGLIDQVFKGVPDINALGFFHIGLHLFPTVFSFAITSATSVESLI